jgi:hypothetical protein
MHNGGSSIVNFNATTRVGSGSIVAGTFAATTNTAVYSGADGGVYATPHAVDTAVFQWISPARGTGQVTFYVAGFQGSTSSSNGQNSTITGTSNEIATGITRLGDGPHSFFLSQNYPDPFNPTTSIRYDIPVASEVRLVVFDGLGRLVSVLVDERKEAGSYEAIFNGADISSGVYFYRLQAGAYFASKKLLLLR